MKLTNDLMVYFFHTIFKGPDGDWGSWPDWWKGVISMYASELAVNHFLRKENVLIEEDLLDAHSESPEWKRERHV